MWLPWPFGPRQRWGERKRIQGSSTVLPLIISAQAMPAILLASATVTTLNGRRSSAVERYSPRKQAQRERLRSRQTVELPLHEASQGILQHIRHFDHVQLSPLRSRCVRLARAAQRLPPCRAFRFPVED